MKATRIASILAVIAALAVACSLLGCSAESTEQASVSEASVSQEAAYAEAAPEKHEVNFDRNQAQAAGAKEETVFVKADATGAVEDVTVSTVLRQTGDALFVLDQSNLSGIVNTEGNEEFSQRGTELLWENKGKEITYEGTSAQALPVGVKVRYFLNGIEVSPEQIAGKSGPVRIRFDYSQATGLLQPTYVFTTMVVLDHRHFSNIQVENGVCSSMGDMELVTGYAVPELKNATGLAKLEGSEDLGFPEYLGINADATDFQLDYTTTVATSGLFKNTDTEKMNSGEDLVGAIGQLEGSSAEILSGIASLDQGAGMFGDALKQYTDGAQELNQGASALAQGISTLNTGSGDLSEGAKSLAGGLSRLDETLDLVDTKALEDFGKQLEEIRPIIEAIVNIDLNELEERILAALDYFEDVQAQLQDAAERVNASAEALQALQQELETLRADIAALKDQGVDTTALEGHLETALQELSNAKDAIASIDLPQIEFDFEALKQCIQEQFALLDQLRELLKPLEDLPEFSEIIKQIEDLKDAVSALSEGASQLEAGMGLYAEGVASLNEGAGELKAGADLLGSSGVELYRNYGTLAQGISTLLAGYQVFDAEGIQRLGQLGGDDLSGVFEQIRRQKTLDENPRSFAGRAEGTTGNVKYLIETAGIVAH